MTMVEFALYYSIGGIIGSLIVLAGYLLVNYKTEKDIKALKEQLKRHSEHQPGDPISGRRIDIDKEYAQECAKEQSNGNK